MTKNKHRINKAPKTDKSHKHSKETASLTVLEKELPAFFVKKVVSRIKKVRKAYKGYEPASKAETESDGFIITKHKINPARSSRKGHLNTLCYWTGAFVSDCAAAFTPQKEKVTI